MNKQEFLFQLQKGLAGLPKNDIDERMNFYSEMIDDRIEDGLSEQDAVSDIGSVDLLISQIISDIPLSKLVKERISPKKRMKAWEIILLVLGSPIWLSLLIALLSVILTIYIVLWSLILILWSVFASFAVLFLAGAAGCILFAVKNNILTGIAVFGIGIICAGLSIFLFFGCKESTKFIISATKKLVCHIKNRLIKKEEA